MKLHSFFAVLLLASCGLMATGLGQSLLPPNIGPVTFVLNGSSGTYVVNPSLNGQSYCTVTVPSTATMGGGTITLKVSADNGANWFAVTGLPDLGSGASPSQTITVAGTQLTAPVSGKTGFEVVLSGATNAVITGSITCALGSGATGSNSGSSGGTSTVTCASPGCVIASPLPNFATTQPVSLASLPPPVQPSPLYTQPVHDAAPVQPSPLYTTPVTTPAPLASQSPWPWPAMVNLHPGSGTTLYGDTWPDTIATTANIATATTTLIVSGVASQTMYVYYVGWELSGTNSVATLTLEYGQGATCGTNTQKIFPSALAPTATTSGFSFVLYGGALSTVTGGMGGIIPAAYPLIVPANATAYNLCGVTAGTTIAGAFVAYYAIHAN